MVAVAREALPFLRDVGRSRGLLASRDGAVGVLEGAVGRVTPLPPPPPLPHTARAPAGREGEGRKVTAGTAVPFSVLRCPSLSSPLPSSNAPSGAKSYMWSAATTAPCPAVSTGRRSPESSPAGRAGGTSEGGRDERTALRRRSGPPQGRASSRRPGGDPSAQRLRGPPYGSPPAAVRPPLSDASEEVRSCWQGRRSLGRASTAPVAPSPEDGGGRKGINRQGQGVGAACLVSHGPTNGVGTCEG